MNKPLSLEQLDHVCLIAERLVDCNNAVSENYHTNMLITRDILIEAFQQKTVNLLKDLKKSLLVETIT